MYMVSPSAAGRLQLAQHGERRAIWMTSSSLMASH